MFEPRKCSARSEIVEKAAGFGLPHDKICQLIVSERTGKPIDPKTLRSAFRAELDRGVAVAEAAVANALYNNAVHSNNVAAQIWWSKARMRWSETVGHQYLDEHGKPTAPVIHYIGRPEPEVAPEAMGSEGEGHESD